MRTPAVLHALALTLFLAACGSAPAQTGSAPQPRAARASANRLTAEEIAGAKVSNVYEAIQQLRPQFLTSRGVSSVRGGGAAVRVRIDNNPGTLDDLRRLAPNEVAYVRYYSAADATIMTGTGENSALIQVVTVRGGMR